MDELTPLVPYTVAIVEDEEILREELAFQLEPYGFAVKTFADAPAFYRYLVTRPRTLVVLDIGLAGEDGLSICAYLRGCDPHIGIVFMTARGLRQDRLTGLEAGADAYLVKPIDVAELALILRRLGDRLMASQSQTAGPSGQSWTLDERKATLTAPNNAPIRVSINELLLLRFMLQERPGAICTHADLNQALGQFSPDGSRHRLEVIVSRLRERVYRICGIPLPLQSERGVGYVFLAE